MPEWQGECTEIYNGCRPLEHILSSLNQIMADRGFLAQPNSPPHDTKALEMSQWSSVLANC